MWCNQSYEVGVAICFCVDVPYSHTGTANWKPVISQNRSIQ